jgi:AAA+ ATPase superfamily predicted ATPase
MFIEPVSGRNFFGREEVLATLHKRVSAIKGGYRQNLAITGPMLAGKSSILRHFLKNLKDADAVPVYVEMTSDDFETFVVRFTATLIYQYLKVCALRTDGDLRALKDAARQHIPRTIAHADEIAKCMEAKRFDDAYEKLLDLTSVLKAETGKNCIVILDEFHNLSNFALKKPFQTFGKFIMVQKNTMYIVSSSQKTLLKEILSKKLSLLFGNFEIIEINGFDSPTSRAFMADKTRDTAFPELLKNYIIQISQGNPFYIETMIKQVLSLSKGSAVTSETLLEALSNLLYESDGLMNQYFMNHMNFFLEKKNRKKFIPVLLAIAHGNCKMKLITQYLGRKDSELGSILEKLQYMDLVAKNGVFYKVQDKLFEFWLKNVYGLKSAAQIDDMDIKSLEFKGLVLSDHDDYARFAAKSPAELLTDLFSSFQDDKVSFNMYERILPKFSSVEPRKINETTWKFLGRVDRTENYWIFYAKLADMIDDHDITAASTVRFPEKNKKIVRRVLIPFKGIEHNAFLMAKDLNLWVWDIEEINKLLRNFGKFELVI